jgi:hypothetical protein
MPVVATCAAVAPEKFHHTGGNVVAVSLDQAVLAEEAFHLFLRPFHSVLSISSVSRTQIGSRNVSRTGIVQS